MTSLLIIFYFTPNNGLWLSFYFLLMSNPLELFYGEALRYIPLTKTASLDFVIAANFVLLIKSKNRSLLNSCHFNRILNALFIYSILLVIIGLIYGFGISEAYIVIKQFSIYGLFIIIPSLLMQKRELSIFIQALFYVFIILSITQLYEFAQGSTFRYMLVGGFDYSKYTYLVMRLIYMPYINYFILIISFLLYIKKSDLVNKRIILITLFLAIFTIILSATRGWIIAYAFVLLFYVLFGANLKERFKTGLLVIACILLFLLSIKVFPGIQNQLDKAMNRIQTIEAIYDQTIRGERVNQQETQEMRTTVRAPRVYKKFTEGNIIFGYGFSAITTEYYDRHVAFISVPLLCGIIGSLLILLFIGKLIKYNLLYYTKNSVYRSYAFLFISAYIGLLIIGTTSTTVYSYLIDTPQTILLSLLILFNERVYKEEAFLKW